MSLGRFLRTVRHLRPVQVAAALQRRLPRRAIRAAGPVALRRPAGWVEPLSRRRSLFPGPEMWLLNQRIRLTDGASWQAGFPPLILYNLHYFDDLAAPDGDEEAQRALIARWLAENPAGRGIGWHAYPASLRLVNWLKWVMAGREPVPGMLDSLATHAAWIAANVETHLMANHVLANAKALLFAGLLLDAPQRATWLRRGLRLLRAEVAEQVLPDGGHFERSPMYHAVVLEDLLDVLNLQREFDFPAGAMLEWMLALTHPDGEIAFFNDAAFGVAAPAGELIAYARRLGVPAPSGSPPGATLLQPSGFARLQRGSAVLVADVGSVGPSYQPGHAHAGTLSFELSAGGARLIVNSGTSTYQPGPQRESERATPAHNTVAVAGESSSEVWASFRVGRRARVTERTASGDRLAAAHDGYRHLGVLHRREWMLHESALVIRDTLTGDQPAEGFLHFAPGRMPRVGVDGADVVEESSEYHPRFGESLPNKRLRLTFRKPEVTTTISW